MEELLLNFCMIQKISAMHFKGVDNRIDSSRIAASSLDWLFPCITL